MAQQPKQQAIPADQLVNTKYQSIGRCNNYVMLLNILCSVECKIFGILLVDHAFSHALTATTDVPGYTLAASGKSIHCSSRLEVYSKISQDFSRLLVMKELLTKLLWWDFLHYVHQKKDLIPYPHFTKLIITDLMRKFPSISPRLEEDYHSIKDDVPLGSMYTTGNVMVRGMLSPSKLLTDEICATKEYKAYEEKFVRESLKVTIKQKKPSTTPIPPPSDDRKQDELAEATILSLTMHKTTLAAEAQENVAIVKEKILEEDIDNMIDGEDENSYASAFAASLFQDEEDTGTRIEPELTVDKTNELMKEAIPRMVNDAVNKDREIFTDVVPELLAKEFATHAPKILKEMFKRHMKNKVLNVHPITSIPTTKKLLI
ncbi:hypothetical protein Tco_0369245 [Tanacetum coccineum]